MQQRLVVAFINPASRASGVETDHAPGDQNLLTYNGKNIEKISETKRPTAYIFIM